MTVGEWYLQVPLSVSFGNTAFCQHSVFKLAIPFSEHTAVTSAKHINRLFFVMGTSGTVYKAEIEMC